MRLIRYYLFILSALGQWCILYKVSAVWTSFDLVRPFKGWGSNGTTPFIKISNEIPGLNLSAGDNFGYSIANIGDLNGDGNDDIAVGAIGQSVSYDGGITQQINAGGLYILFLGDYGNVLNVTYINPFHNNGPKIYAGDQFGYSVANIGDVDGDGVTDIAVGAPGYIYSSVYILFLHPNGTVKHSQLIRGLYNGNIPATYNNTLYNTTTSYYSNSSYQPNGPPIQYGSRFGTALTTLGDLNHDGIPDLAVSAVGFNGKNRVYFLYLNHHGLVLNYFEFGPNYHGGPSDISEAFSSFGSSMMMIPPVGIDNLPALAIGAPLINAAGSLNINSGLVVMNFLNDHVVSINHTVTLDEYSSIAKYGVAKTQLPFKVCCYLIAILSYV